MARSLNSEELRDRKLITAKLAEYGQRYPVLKPLINSLPPDLRFTKSWLRRFRRSNVSVEVKSNITRAMFGDPVIYGLSTPPSFTFDMYARMVTYLYSMAGDPWRDPWEVISWYNVPKPIQRISGLKASTPTRFLAEFLVKPYIKMCFDRGSLTVGGVELNPRSAEAGSLLRPAYIARLLDDASCQELLDHGRRYQYAFYFDSGIEILDLRNCVRYMFALFDQYQVNPRIQNKLPVMLTNRFHLPRLSLPTLFVALDVIGLAAAGLIDLNQVSVKKDFLGLKSWLPLESPYRQLDGFAELLDQAASLFLLRDEQANKLYETSGKRNSPAKYLSGYLFNMERLIYGSERRESIDSRFEVYYEAVDHKKLWIAIAKHFREINTDYLNVLISVRRRHPDSFVGIRARDLANVMYMLWYHEDDYGEYLPPVARFAMGEPEPEITGRSSGVRSNARRKYHAQPRKIRPRLSRKLPLVDTYLDYLEYR